MKLLNDEAVLRLIDEFLLDSFRRFARRVEQFRNQRAHRGNYEFGILVTADRGSSMSGTKTLRRF